MGLVYQLRGSFDVGEMQEGPRAVAAYGDSFGRPEIQAADLGVFRDVHQYGTGPSGLGDVEGFGDHFRDFFGSGDLIIPLRDGPTDPDDVGLLKGVGTE